MSDFRNFIEQKSMMTITLRVNWDIKTWVESQTLPKVQNRYLGLQGYKAIGLESRH